MFGARKIISCLFNIDFFIHEHLSLMPYTLSGYISRPNKKKTIAPIHLYICIYIYIEWIYVLFMYLNTFFLVVNRFDYFFLYLCSSHIYMCGAMLNLMMREKLNEPSCAKKKRFFLLSVLFFSIFVYVCAFSLPGNLCGRLDNNHVTGFRRKPA